MMPVYILLMLYINLLCFAMLLVCGFTYKKFTSFLCFIIQCLFFLISYSPSLYYISLKCIFFCLLIHENSFTFAYTWAARCLFPFQFQLLYNLFYFTFLSMNIHHSHVEKIKRTPHSISSLLPFFVPFVRNSQDEKLIREGEINRDGWKSE